MTDAPLIEARGISMEFPGVCALDGVDFDVRPGEVHALIGENGAGKSTLVRILAGELAGWGGELSLDGIPRRLATPGEAIDAGIAVIPQELQLVSSYFALGMKNWGVLFSMGWSAFRLRRKKQLQLVELAFIKSRRRRGEAGRDLDVKEQRLRYDVVAANQRGVWIGN